MRTHTILAITLIVLLHLACQFGHCDPLATPIVPEAMGNQPDHLKIAIMPIMTLAMNADVSKAAWDVIVDLFETKGYQVVPYDDTLRAMARLEIFPTRLCGVTASGDPNFIAWWHSSRELDEDPETIKALCQALGVSRVITVLPSAMDVKVDLQQGLGAAAGYFSGGLTELLSKQSQKIAITVTAAAWGSQTGRCVWEASNKAYVQTKKSYRVRTVLGDVRTKSIRSAAMLPEVLQDAILSTFGEFFQRDRVIYGTLGIEIPMSPVTCEAIVSKAGKLEGVRLTWGASADPRVSGYAIYRAIGDDLFPPYPSAVTRDAVYLDKDVNTESSEEYHYFVVAVTRDGIEGRNSEPCHIRLLK